MRMWVMYVSCTRREKSRQHFFDLRTVGNGISVGKKRGGNGHPTPMESRVCRWDAHEPSGSLLLKHESMMRRFSSSNNSALDFWGRAPPFPLRSIIQRGAQGWLGEGGYIRRRGIEHLPSRSGEGREAGVNRRVRRAIFG